MFREWKAHNFLYALNYQPDRTRSVDLDNAGEYNFVWGATEIDLFYNGG